MIDGGRDIVGARKDPWRILEDHSKVGGRLDSLEADGEPQMDTVGSRRFFRSIPGHILKGPL